MNDFVLFVQKTPLVAFAILASFMYIGEVLSIKSKTRIPTLLVFVVLLMAGAWSGIIPSNIIEIPGFTSSFAGYIILMYIVDMGSTISLKQFFSQWRTVLIGIGAIVGVGGSILTLGTALYGWQVAAVAAPTVGGGFVATIEMSNAARALGNEALARIPLLIFTLHSIPAYILLPLFLKRHGTKLLKGFVAGSVQETAVENPGEQAKQKMVDCIPAQYKTPVYYLVTLALLAVLSLGVATLLGGKISPTIFALLFGILGVEMGIIESSHVRKSNSSGFLLFASMISIFSPLASANPSEIMSMLVQLAVLVGIGVVGMLITSFVVGKLVGYDTPLALAVGVNSLLGFPMNFFLTQESIKALASTPEEEKFLTDAMMPSMLIAGFVTITIGSIIFASIMRMYL